MRACVLRLLALCLLLALAGCTQQTSAPSGPTPTPIVLRTALPSATPAPPAPVPAAAPPAPPSVYLTLNDQTLVALDAAGGTVRWRVPLERDTAFALVDNVLYVAAQSSVYALNALDGSTRWRSASLGGPFDALAVQNNIVYAAWAGGGLLALNASDGAARWSRRMALNASSLIVDGDWLYASDLGGALAGLDLNGNVIWETGAPNLSFSRAAAANGTVFVAENATDVNPAPADIAAFSQNGQPLWDAQPSGGEFMLAPPVVTPDGMVYTADSQHVYGFSARKGMQLWQAQAPIRDPAPGLLSLAVVGNLIVLGTGSRNTANETQGAILAFSAGEGKPYWQTLLDKEGTSPSMLCQALGSLVIVESSGRLYALDGSSGALLWQNALNQMALPFFTVG